MRRDPVEQNKGLPLFDEASPENPRVRSGDPVARAGPPDPPDKELLRTDQGRVLVYIRACGKRGATCDEVEQGLGLPHQNASARVNWLRDNHYIVDSRTKRLTRSDRPATVWVVV